MSFDPTIRAGDLITATIFSLSVVAAYIRLRERLIAIETKLGPLWEEFAERRTGLDRRSIHRWPPDRGDTGE